MSAVKRFTPSPPALRAINKTSGVRQLARIGTPKHVEPICVLPSSKPKLEEVVQKRTKQPHVIRLLILIC